MNLERASSSSGCVLQFFLLLGLAVPRLAGQTSSAGEMEMSRHLAAAQKAEESGNYPAASLQYQQILNLQPKLAIIRQSLAITYHLQNRYPEAIAEFQRALRLDATLWGADLFLGMDYYKTNQFALALTPLEKSIALNEKMAEPEARYWLAVTYSALNRPEDAVRELRRDLMLRPGNIDVLYYLVKAYDQAAASVFQRIAAIEPHAAAVSLLQAERFQQENRLDLARVEYRNALRLRPDFAGWLPALDGAGVDMTAPSDLTIDASDQRANSEYAKLLAAAEETPRSDADELLKGLELIRQGQFREAQEPLTHAAEKTSNRALQLLMIRAYVESGDCEKVEDRLKQMLAAQPEDVDALHLLGRSYQRQAEKALQRMMAIDADSYGVHELLGRQHEEKTEYDLAINEYQAALAKRPDLAGIRYAIGNVYRKLSRYEEAEKWLLEELARNPYHGLAHYRLGSIYTEQGKPDAAILHLLQALKSHPQLTGAQLDLARAYTANGRYAEAIAQLQQVVAAEPDNDRVHYLLSIAYSKEGHRAEAQSELAEYQRLTRDRLHRTQQDVKNLSDSLDR